MEGFSREGKQYQRTTETLSLRHTPEMPLSSQQRGLHKTDI